ncbi:serine protease snake-like [Melitaea cinxia]|uniref:serine protease snake-like n=1 Tax=Melitaea cinxia TaxID=113334 RepID=UPI001E2706A5|nr:serine protease snake-like [Melitaea cinxia]
MVECLEYQEKLVYPCLESQNPNEGMIRENRCNWKPDGLIIGGVDSYRGEFPHMVHLGYGKYKTEWECGGVLLSEKFVLTAGHCSKDPRFGPVNKIRIAFLNKSEKVTDVNLYNVKQIYKHPEYKSPLVYNDIALLESDRPCKELYVCWSMQLGRYAVPACLHDGRPINDTEVYATGWGSTMFRFITLPDILQKVALERYSDDECQRRYSNITIRLMPRGYDKKTQICYGHRKMKRDSCKGDSGGPLQVVHPEIKCMYLVTGVVSTSKWCAKPDMPGINTRVAPYLSWIESIVWP